MTLIKHLALALTAGLFALNTLAATTAVNGVKVEDSAMVNGVKLQLNGAGTRYKGPFKVYVADIYASKKVSSLNELVAAPGPKRLTMTMLREIEAGPFGKLLTRGMEDNTSKNEMSKLIPGLIRMSDIFSANKVLLVGDVIMLDWIPGTGMVVTAKGKVQSEPFKEPEFFKAMMSIWLGPIPADWKLKDALLGVK
jgi:hypothetical protein